MGQETTYETLDELLGALAREMAGDDIGLWPDDLEYRPASFGRDFVGVRVPAAVPYEAMENGTVVTKDYQDQPLQLWMKRNDEGGWDPVLLYTDEIQDIVERQRGVLGDLIAGAQEIPNAFSNNSWGWVQTNVYDRDQDGQLDPAEPIPDFQPYWISQVAGQDAKAHSFSDYEVIDLRTGKVMEPHFETGFIMPAAYDQRTRTINIAGGYAIRPWRDGHDLPLDENGYVDMNQVSMRVGWLLEENNTRQSVDPARMGYGYQHYYDGTIDVVPRDTVLSSLYRQQLALLDQALQKNSESVGALALQINAQDLLNDGRISVPGSDLAGKIKQANDARMEQGAKEGAPQIDPKAAGAEDAPESGRGQQKSTLVINGYDINSFVDAPTDSYFEQVDPEKFADILRQYRQIGQNNAPESFESQRQDIFDALDFFTYHLANGAPAGEHIESILNGNAAYQDIFTDYTTRRLLGENPDKQRYVDMVEHRLLGRDVEVSPVPQEQIGPGVDGGQEFVLSLQTHYDRGVIDVEAYQQAQRDIAELDAFLNLDNLQLASKEQRILMAIERNPDYRQIFAGFAQEKMQGGAVNMDAYMARLEYRYKAINAGNLGHAFTGKALGQDGAERAPATAPKEPNVVAPDVDDANGGEPAGAEAQEYTISETLQVADALRDIEDALQRTDFSDSAHAFVVDSGALFSAAELIGEDAVAKLQEIAQGENPSAQDYAEYIGKTLLPNVDGLNAMPSVEGRLKDVLRETIDAITSYEGSNVEAPHLQSKPEKTGAFNAAEALRIQNLPEHFEGYRGKLLETLDQTAPEQFEAFKALLEGAFGPPSATDYAFVAETLLDHVSNAQNSETFNLDAYQALLQMVPDIRDQAGISSSSATRRIFLSEGQEIVIPNMGENDIAARPPNGVVFNLPAEHPGIIDADSTLLSYTSFMRDPAYIEALQASLREIQPSLADAIANAADDPEAAQKIIADLAGSLAVPLPTEYSGDIKNVAGAPVPELAIGEQK